MSCGCSNINKNDGKNVVDLIRSKGKENFPLRNSYDIECVNCKETFTMRHMLISALLVIWFMGLLHVVLTTKII